jgi:hypothetical protein
MRSEVPICVQCFERASDRFKPGPDKSFRVEDYLASHVMSGNQSTGFEETMQFSRSALAGLQAVPQENG